jgi:hypothetical protein
MLKYHSGYCDALPRVPCSYAVRRAIVSALALLAAAPAGAQPRAPLHDSVTLNIGINCQWRQRCIDQQQHAMRRALSYVRTQRPANWKIQLCNRNAARGRYRVDWIGFDNCIRNAALRIPKRMSQLRASKLIVTRT